MKLRLSTAMALLFVLLASSAVRAELSKQERDTAKSMAAGTLYLRLDVPCKYGGGYWRLKVDSMLEVSPTGYDVDRKLSLPRKKNEFVYWRFLPNDGVRYGKLSFSGDTVQLWLEGAPPKIDELAIDFIHIQTMDDFIKAFNQTFSKVPLQDEHPEWPADVRQAIAERKVVAGMTKEQVFCVVGRPIKVTTGEENGVKVETWFPRQEKGTASILWRDKTLHTGFPALLKFADGKLQVIDQTPGAPDLSAK
ncbi:MAG: hypothetical protein ACHQKY_18650 [Terriglobia bacterium]